MLLGFLVIAAAAGAGCSSTGSGTAIGGGQGGAGGGLGGGDSGAGGGTSAGTVTGITSGGKGAKGAGGKGAGGSGGAVTCTPGVQSLAIIDCGYPAAGGSPLSSVEFNESEVLRAIQATGGWPTATIRVFYNDEHALTLGVRQVIVNAANGTTKTDYPISALATNPGSATDPKTGTNDLAGPQSGLDVSKRPMWPALFVTDITSNPDARSGDWQQGGRPHGPNAVFGTWKGAVRTVDATVMPNLITITPDPDPMKNNWMLAGGDPVPAGLTVNEGFGTEVVWNVPLIPRRSYRLQAMVHDGDQNKAGGDSGEACVIYCAGGTAPADTPDAGTVPPPNCPMGTTTCGSSAGALTCSGNSVCANGCCLRLIE